MFESYNLVCIDSFILDEELGGKNHHDRAQRTTESIGRLKDSIFKLLNQLCTSYFSFRTKNIS